LKRKRSYIVQRLFCLFQALAILNFSIDPPEWDSEEATLKHETMSVNEIDSICELVLELGFEMEDAVPEQDSPDQERTFLKKVNYLLDSPYTYLPRKPLMREVEPTFHIPSFYSAYLQEINPPPPKA
jgi:hypothetical protein